MAQRRVWFAACIIFLMLAVRWCFFRDVHQYVRVGAFRSFFVSGKLSWGSVCLLPWLSRFSNAFVIPTAKSRPLALLFANCATSFSFLFFFCQVWKILRLGYFEFEFWEVITSSVIRLDGLCSACSVRGVLLAYRGHVLTSFERVRMSVGLTLTSTFGCVGDGEIFRRGKFAQNGCFSTSATRTAARCRCWHRHV